MNSRVRSLALCLVLLASIATAENIRFDAPAVTTHHSVDAIVTGNWPQGCLPSVKSVTLNGSTIQLHLDARPPLGVFCIQLVSPYTRLFHLDVLPAGSYTVILLGDNGDSATELARTPLVVRDAETLNIRPYALPVSGGPILVNNPFFLADATITIGGLTALASDSDMFMITAPPHAAGAVDVVVNSSAGTLTAKAALLYYDPTVADPAVFGPILYPLSFQGPGALGSQWTTESFIDADLPPAYFRDVLPCDGCLTMFALRTAQLTNDSNPWGHVLYALRGTTGSLNGASRIRDTSRQSQTAGTEVPIVHERDFRARLRFLNVPIDNRYRAMLRVWSIGEFPQVVASVEPFTALPFALTRIPGTSMWFGSVDVTSLLPTAIDNPAVVTVFPSAITTLPFPPIWGMLSLTNNDTQQVTIISPQ